MVTEMEQPYLWQVNLTAPWRRLDDDSVLEAVRIFESYLPRGHRLRWADLKQHDWGQHLVRVWSRRRLLAQVAARDQGMGECVFESAEKAPRAAIWLKSRTGTSTADLRLEIDAWWDFQPLLTAAQIRELLARMGTAIGADRGTGEICFPHRDERYVAQPYHYRSGWLSCPWPPSEGFPRRFWHAPKEQGGPPIVGGIKWINYWSREVCEVMGFPPADRGAYHDAWPLPGGAWIWQLTEDPIEWLRREHRMQYKRALLAFPLIGNRDPRWPKPPQRQLGGYFVEFHLACPPRGPSSEDDRPLRLVETVERLFHDDIAAGDTPPFPFEFVCDTELSRLAPKPPGTARIPDRAAWLALPHDGDIPTLNTGAGPASQFLQARQFDHPPPGYLYVRIFLSYAFPRQPTLADRKTDQVLETCARLMNAYWGRALHTHIRAITDAQVDMGDPRDVHPDYLPVLRPPWEMPDIFTPTAIGQVNYWSAETCRRVGFPPGGDPAVMAWARETEGGGWIWALPEGLFWMELVKDEERLERYRAHLRRAYERFPAVGGRAPR